MIKNKNFLNLKFSWTNFISSLFTNNQTLIHPQFNVELNEEWYTISISFFNVTASLFVLLSCYSDFFFLFRPSLPLYSVRFSLAAWPSTHNLDIYCVKDIYRHAENVHHSMNTSMYTVYTRSPYLSMYLPFCARSAMNTNKREYENVGFCEAKKKKKKKFQ